MTHAIKRLHTKHRQTLSKSLCLSPLPRLRRLLGCVAPWTESAVPPALNKYEPMSLFSLEISWQGCQTHPVDTTWHVSLCCESVSIRDLHILFCCLTRTRGGDWTLALKEWIYFSDFWFIFLPLSRDTESENGMKGQNTNYNPGHQGDKVWPQILSSEQLRVVTFSPFVEHFLVLAWLLIPSHSRLFCCSYWQTYVLHGDVAAGLVVYYWPRAGLHCRADASTVSELKLTERLDF